MRSKNPLPVREPGHLVPFLEAAALFAALCIFARSAVLVLAAFIAAPLPAVQTVIQMGQQTAQQQQAGSAPELPALPEEPASSVAPEAVQAPAGSIEDYLVPLLGEDACPADAGAVIEKQYPQGNGEKYIPCGAGSIKNNTRQTAADIADEIENPLPFAIEPNSPDPQVLVMHTHATEDYRLSAGLWFAPGDGARSTDRVKPGYVPSIARSHAAANRRFCRQFGSVTVVPLSLPQMSITCAACRPCTVQTGAIREPLSVSMASRWTSSTILMLGYWARYCCTTARLLA